MRCVASVLACVGIALAVAGCSDADKHYFKEGVGANLYAEAALPVSEDLAGRTALQNTYVAEICKQAGLAEGSCDIDTFSPTTWSLFVQAGMNDIDQRCDAYLTWLDNVRRAKAPTIKEIADAQTASTVIMQTTGVGAAPIAVVAAAFGFATNTFTNVTSRLVLEVDRATVQAVVLGNQKKFREDVLGTGESKTKIEIASRPAAIYALRSYLRLCMPMTIETQINSTIATFERGGAVALITGEPMIAAKSVGPTVILTPSPRGPSYLRLRGLIFPGGKGDRAIAAYVEGLLGPPRLPVGVLLNGARYAPLYDRISNCIDARNAGQACPAGSLQKFR